MVSIPKITGNNIILHKKLFEIAYVISITFTKLYTLENVFKNDTNKKVSNRYLTLSIMHVLLGTGIIIPVLKVYLIMHAFSLFHQFTRTFYEYNNSFNSTYLVLTVCTYSM